MDYQRCDLKNIKPIDFFLEARRHAPEAFFFESAPAIDAAPDFSIVGFGPYEVLRDMGDYVERASEEQTTTVDQPFFSLLEEMISSLRPSPQEEATCRFHRGGVFGCIGYDVISEIESRLKNSGYFKKPSSYHSDETGPRAEVFIARKLVIFEHGIKAIHLVDAALSPMGSHSIDIKKMKELIESSRPSESASPRPHPPFSEERLQPTLGYEEFKKRVEAIKHHVREGDIFQAVLAERFDCSLEAEPMDVFMHLRRINPSPYSFFLPMAGRSFFGASPEALIRIEGKRIISHPIAGTRRRGRTPYEDRLMARSLSRSRKEAAEHLMLVDLARNDLGRIAVPGTVRVRDFRTIRYLSNVMHLVSEVEAEIAAGVSALEALQACFPAGTLSGAPKVRAMEILANLETVPRGLYGGAVVAFDSIGNLDSCIAIRSLEMKGRNAILRAGAGIVADSRPEYEYAEVSHKLKAIKEAISAAETGVEA